jgi:4-amino-4-deoxychorismate lyase/para-aminobenzoate synthetase/4-amino-4-deoxychorismate lyase
LGAVESLIVPALRFDLIETMAFDPEAGLPMLELHLARLTRSAAQLGFRFDRHALRNELQAVTFGLRGQSRVRVLLGPGGEMAIEVRAHRPWPLAVVPVAIRPRGAPADDIRLHHKTTDRSIYEAAMQAGGTFEVLLVDHAGFLTEGCFSNIFVERGDRLLTPPAARGLLPGVLRQSLLDRGEAIEAELKPYDLEDGFFIGNAARGLVAARLVAPKG